MSNGQAPDFAGYTEREVEFWKAAAPPGYVLSSIYTNGAATFVKPGESLSKVPSVYMPAPVADYINTIRITTRKILETMVPTGESLGDAYLNELEVMIPSVVVYPTGKYMMRHELDEMRDLIREARHATLPKDKETA